MDHEEDGGVHTIPGMPLEGGRDIEGIGHLQRTSQTYTQCHTVIECHTYICTTTSWACGVDVDVRTSCHTCSCT